MTQKYQFLKKAALVVIGLLFCIGAVYLINVRLRYLEYSSVDLQQDYYAANHLVNHESIYSDTEYLNYHPPIAAVLLVPLSYLPYKDAAIIWTVLSIILYTISGWLVFRELKIHLPREYLLIFFGFSFSWHPFLMNIGLGQWSIVIGFFIVLCWICLRHDRNILAGIILGLACLIKFYPGLLIVYMLLMKRWKALVTTILVVMLGTIIIALVVGPKEVVYYFTTILPSDTNRYSTSPENYSILGILGKFFAGGYLIEPIFISPISINLLAIILDIGVLIILVRTMLNLPIDKDSNDVKFALSLIAMLFISPVFWQHNLTILTIPIFILLMKIVNESFHMKYGYGLVLFGIILLSLPDIPIGRFLIELTYPDRLPWYLGFVFLFYDLGLLILWLLLHWSRNINVGKIEIQ